MVLPPQLRDTGISGKLRQGRSASRPLQPWGYPRPPSLLTLLCPGQTPRYHPLLAPPPLCGLGRERSLLPPSLSAPTTGMTLTAVLHLPTPEWGRDGRRDGGTHAGLLDSPEQPALRSRRNWFSLGGLLTHRLSGRALASLRPCRHPASPRVLSLSPRKAEKHMLCSLARGDISLEHGLGNAVFTGTVLP